MARHVFDSDLLMKQLNEEIQTMKRYNELMLQLQQLDEMTLRLEAARPNYKELMEEWLIKEAESAPTTLLFEFLQEIPLIVAKSVFLACVITLLLFGLCFVLEEVYKRFYIGHMSYAGVVSPLARIPRQVYPSTTAATANNQRKCGL